MKKTIKINTETQMQSLAKKFASHCPKKLVVYLSGDLGAGKTTFVRAVLRGLDYQGKVKSPTFTLVEPYEINDCKIYHFDLYRLIDPEELEYMGIRDFFEEDALCFIEWPEKGIEHLPVADLQCSISVQEDGGRLVAFETKSDLAVELLMNIEE